MVGKLHKRKLYPMAFAGAEIRSDVRRCHDNKNQGIRGDIKIEHEIFAFYDGQD